ncbi:hypothetical protein PC110_g18212 [Phytophthora cactorum]|uniref:Uncharacterized protein n=1 Tax=Phytophthora cactorum TaxID=29920 RepID=A0A329RPR5_9STRA|nr:hypothetical protein PC110_g18212 [Phytophthora cactorum]
MVTRFFAIKDFVDTSDDELADLMPTRHEENKLRLLLDDLRAFKSASKKLQSDEKVTLLDVRDLFETLIERHPSDAEYLAANASVVKNPAFENACVKVLLGKEMELTGNNHELLAAFATPVSSRPSNDEDDSNDRDGFANLCVRARYSVSKLECAVASSSSLPLETELSGCLAMPVMCCHSTATASFLFDLKCYCFSRSSAAFGEQRRCQRL